MDGNKVTLKSKLLYGMGDIYGGGAFLVINLLFLNFLTDVEKLAPYLAGSIFLIGKVWDAVSDPLMGIISDRTKSRYGRRRIYFLAGIIPVLLSFFMLWYSFGIESQTGLFIYYLLAYTFFSTAFTMVMIPYSAILPDMTDDYKERTSLSGFRLIFSALSAIVAGVLPKIIINAFGSNETKGYMIMGAALAVFYAIPWLLVFIGTYERKDRSETQDSGFNAFKELRATLRNKSFRIHTGIFLSSLAAVDFLTTLFIYYLTYCLNRPKEFSAVLGALLVVQVVAMPVHIKLSKRYGKTMPLKVGFGVWTAALIAALFVNEGQSSALVYGIAILSGIGTSAAVFVPWSILPEIADVDEMISTRRREGIYCGMATLLRKMAQAVTVFVIGIILQWSGYIPNVEQTQFVKTVIKVLFSIAPIICIVLGVVFAGMYKMTEGKYKLLKAEIDRRKNGGAAASVKDESKNICEELTGISYEKLWGGM
ncbi:MAG: MFS transporter [Bacillota bacterium]